MRTRRSDLDRQDVVARRLALVSPVPTEQADGTREPPPGATASSEGPPWWAEHTRVRDRTGPWLEREETVPEPASPAPAGVAIPLPGRHASRRSGTGPPRSLHLGMAQLATVAVLVAIGLAAAGWWVVRSEPVPVSQPVAPGVEPTVLALPSAGTSGDKTSAGTVVVDVAGDVRRPGVLELPAGSRVVDAIEAAGGPRGDVDLSGLNLARVLVDGEQVLVGDAAGTPAPGPSGGPPVGGVPLVDLNTADLAALDALPEIGPVTAQAIVSWREEHGGFTAVQELLEVDGIGPATLETLVPLVTV